MSDLPGFNHGRRKMMQYSVAIALMSLSGCCTLFGGRNPPQIPGEIPSGLKPILAPAGINKISELSQAIDVHAHFFNAKDVPVSGYLGGQLLIHARVLWGDCSNFLPLMNGYVNR